MFDYRNLKNPEYFKENRLPAHSAHEVWESRAGWRTGENTLRMSLNGLWKICVARNEGQAVPRFEMPETDVSGWEDIPVPAHIQTEGHGVPQYTNVQYPWDGHEAIEPGELPEKFNPVALYVKHFALPGDMRGKRVFLSLQGAESCAAVWLNGRYVGFASDSFTPSEFELTPYLREGVNRLALRVYRFCAGSWAEDQDFMRFSGLFRDVFLYAAPKVFPHDVSVKNYVNETLDGAETRIAVRVSTQEPWTLEARLLWQGQTVHEGRWHGEGDNIEAAFTVQAPRLWSAEKPNLYDLELTFFDMDNRETAFVTLKTGFRRFEMKNARMLLNGRRVVFKGVNRHDFCAETGRAVTIEHLKRDLEEMKRLNINAVRTSHYPNTEAFYDLCDELGLYVIAENNMETHGVWEKMNREGKGTSYALPGDRKEWRGMMMDRVLSTYHRDKNHPSILIWSVGNESFGGGIIREMSLLFEKLDDTRLVHYEGVHWDPRFPDTTDMTSQMYTPASDVRAYVRAHPEKPFILCEYAHAMGNSLGGLHKYAFLPYEEEGYQGGFIWDYLDQSLRGKDRHGKEVYLYGGDFGDHPNDGNFCGNGILYADGGESPKVQEVKYCYQSVFAEVFMDRAVITNRALFTDCAELDCIATLKNEDKVIVTKKLDVRAAPGCTAETPLPLPEFLPGGEYVWTLSFRLKNEEPWAPAGFETAFAQGVFTVKMEDKPPEPALGRLRVVRGLNNLGVHGEHFTALFSYSKGGLEAYIHGGKNLLNELPMPSFWRAPTDNDRGNGLPFRAAQWKTASLYAGIKRMDDGITVKEEDDRVTITFRYDLPAMPACGCSVAYTVFLSGRVEVTLRTLCPDGLPDMPRFGMLLHMPDSYDRVRYYGMGPMENYVDRRHGARLDVHQTTAGENLAKYLVPQECGTRTGTRWAEITDRRGRGLRFEGDGFSFSALPYNPHELENARHPSELPQVCHTAVSIDQMQMGVGGDNSWGARTHDEYLIPSSGEKCFSFSFIGIV